MYCKYCGRPIHEQAVICMNCGCPVERPGGTVRTQPFHNPDPACCCEPQTSNRNGVVALILLLTLGPLGIHRFYAGRIGSGICMALLFIAAQVCRVHPEIPVRFLSGTETILIRIEGTGMLVVLGIWWLIDLITICRGRFLDAHRRRIRF